MDVNALYRSDINALPLLSRAEKKDIYEKIKDGTQREADEARKMLVTHNLRLVFKYAFAYSNHGIPFEDLIEEGNLGLMVAAEKFEPHRGNEFSTYATWWIRQRIDRYVTNNSRSVRVPEYQSAPSTRLRMCVDELTQELGRDPCDQDLADRMGLTLLEILEIKNNSAVVVSLDGPDDDPDEEELTLMDISSYTGESVERQVDRRLIMEEIRTLVAKARFPNEGTRLIVMARLGINGSESLREPVTLEELSIRFGLTKERIRQRAKAGIELIGPKLKELLLEYVQA